VDYELSRGECRTGGSTPGMGDDRERAIATRWWGWHRKSPKAVENAQTSLKL
jgi:hypothetical protein